MDIFSLKKVSCITFRVTSLYVNGTSVVRADTLGILSSTEPTTFQVQTIPKKFGQLQLKLDKVNTDGSKTGIIDFQTSISIPFGITYAVFGGPNANEDLTYTFRDGRLNLSKLNCLKIVFS